MNSLVLLALISSISVAAGLQGGNVPAPNVTEKLFYDITGDSLETTNLKDDPVFLTQEPTFKAFIDSYVPRILDNQHNEEPSEGGDG